MIKDEKKVYDCYKCKSKTELTQTPFGKYICMTCVIKNFNKIRGV